MLRLSAIVVSCFVSPCVQAGPPSFLSEVEPLLTRLGCNQGACHGKNAGQNGFRLSLRGYAPEWDHEWITREAGGRRINLASPGQSLLLTKPLGLVPHAGGVLIQEDGREHRLLLAWIRAGAPGPSKAHPELTRLAVTPARASVRPGAAFDLRVHAEFADGVRKDVTWLTQFESNDASVAAVTPKGGVKVIRPGETAIRASFLGHVAIAMVTAPHEAPVEPRRFARKNNFIDELVFQKLAALRIEPSDEAGDSAFLRRAYLDTIGVLPTVAQTRAFLEDARPDRRARLIDQLLERPEFVDFWTWWLDDLLQNRRESDHDVRGAKGVRRLHHWLRQQVAVNRPWDELARDILTATGATDDNPAVGYYIVTVGEKREAHQSSIVASAAQTFLGTRIGCAQCHNHPLERYTQDDYYHFSAFFSRVSLQRKDPRAGATVLKVSHADPKQNKNPVGVTQPRTGKFLPPRPLDRRPVDVAPDSDPRTALAAWITAPDNEAFAGAMVNRIWAHYLGVGLVEPIDDLRASNPPSNPDLWQALIKEFVASKYDCKALMRLILNSRVYQQSAATRPSNEKDSRHYSHYYARRLPAEVLLDAICQVTGVPESFEGYPVGLRAVQVPDPAVKSYFLGVFGRSERLSACACERNSEVTLPQTLHLRGGDTLADRINHPAGLVSRLLKAGKTDAEIVDEVFLSAFCRMPRPAERQTIDRALAGAGPAEREVALRDVLWAVLNTQEFAFCH